MSEDTNASAEPQAGDAADIKPQPQAGTSTTPEPQAGDGHETISLDEARKLRSEAANLRKRMKAYEDAEKQAAEAKKAADEAQLSEIDRVKKQHADIQAKHDALLLEMQETKLQQSVERYANELKFKHPEIAIKLLERAELEFDNGSAKNVKQLLEKILKDIPELAQAPAEPPTPAQTFAQRVAPVTSPNNPGKSNTLPPGALPPGKPVRLDDVQWSR